MSSAKEVPLSETHIVGPIGALLGDRFRIDRLIGNGGMASVYQATDVALGRTVAVKLFRLDSADTAEPERQSGEVSVLASLNHFALVTLFDAGTAVVDGVQRTFIVMEFVDGTDLRARISNGPLPRADVAEIGADLAEALHYVHSRGIIHRDIKPANVLLAPSEFPGRMSHAKLADFGIARLLDSTRLTATGALIGTATYLSPEQALGVAIGPPSDVYSLGLVLLECLTGERAFPGTAVESAMARLQRQPLVPASLGLQWRDVLESMTAREPAERMLPEVAAAALRGIFEIEVGLRSADAALPLSAGGEGGASGTAATAATDATAATERLGADRLTEPTALAPATAATAATAATDATVAMPAAADQTAPTKQYALSEPTAATELFPVAGSGTAGTAGADGGAGLSGEAGTASATSDTGPATAATRPAQDDPGTPLAASVHASHHPRRIRRNLISAAVALAVIVAIIAIVFALRPPEPASAPPSYPAVEGPLGDHLRQLQESVTP